MITVDKIVYRNKKVFERLKSPKRIIGYDIARGIAIFLMLIINFKGALTLHEMNQNWISGIIDFLDRRAAVVLVIVSGIGLSLFTTNPVNSGYDNPRPGSRSALIDRAVFLFIFGHAFSIIWDADILHFYAVFIFIGIFLATRSNLLLFATAFGFWMASFIQFFEIYDFLQDNLYCDFFTGALIDLFFTGYYPVFPWAAFFIIGMFLGRLDFQDKNLRERIMTIGFSLFIFSEFLSRFFVKLLESICSAASSHPDNNMVLIQYLARIMEIDLTIPTPFSVISGIGSGLIIIMFGISLATLQKRKWIEYVVIGGRNTLTLYIVHIVFLVAIGLIFNLYTFQGVLSGVLFAILFFLVYLKWITAWLRKYKTGPFETLMRRFSLLKILNQNRFKPSKTPV